MSTNLLKVLDILDIKEIIMKKNRKTIIIVLSMFLNIYIGLCYSQDNSYQGEKMTTLHELGKEKLAKLQYSEAIKIYQEIKRRSPEDPMFINQTESATNSKILEEQKIRIDKEIIKNIDVSSKVEYLLFSLAGVYKKAKDYDKVFLIIDEMRKAYVDSPWKEKVVYREFDGEEGPLPSDFLRFNLDVVLHEASAKILIEQGKYEEAEQHYQKAISIIENPEKLKVVPEKQIKFMNDLTKTIKKELQNLQNEKREK
jgi:tetratricopeptide (TPR) repeat protein